MSAGDHEAEHGKGSLEITFLTLLEQHGVNVSFEMIYRNERLGKREGQSLGVTDPDQQRAREPGTLRDGYGINRLVRVSALGQGFAHDRHDGAKMLARGELQHDAAIRLVRGDLREHDVRKNLLA